MTDQHPITPPLELVWQWWEAAMPNTETSVKDQLCTKAAQWGADQELEACCKDIIEIIAGVFADRVIDDWDQFVELLRDGRRPQPPSLKEQAYDALDTYIYGEPDPKDKERTYNTIRQALEALPND